MRYGLLFTVLLCLASPARGQTTGSCNLGNATADLDVANVRSRLFNTGGLFFPGEDSGVYEVPKGGGTTAIFASSLWIGGWVEGELRMSAATYDRWEFWPGPLGPNGSPPADCSTYDRIYTVYDGDIRHYNETGAATADMLDWPWQLGAPVFDGDGNTDNYDLTSGDRPYVYGDQTAWWVMNDTGNEHRYSGAPPLRLEVRVTAFAAESPEDSWVRNATFYRYELLYRGASPVDSMYFGIWSDPDLGDAGDDYVGSDSTLGLGFVYNGDDEDGGTSGYGDRPPALGYRFAQGPRVDTDGKDNDRDGTVDEPGERMGATSFVFYVGSSGINGNPTGADELYRYLIPRWRDGSPIAPTGVGLPGAGIVSEAVQFMFPGHPPAFWSMDDIDGAGTRVTPVDVRFVMATGPFRMEPGEVQEIVVAILWARGDDRLDSVDLLKEAAARSAEALSVVMDFDTTAVQPSPSSEPYGYRLAHFPNPVSEVALIEFQLPETMQARLVLYDALGRRVATLADGAWAEGPQRVSLPAAGLAAGAYYLRLETPAFTATRRLTIVR